MFIFVSFHGHNLKVTSVEELTADFSVDAAMTRNQTVDFFYLRTNSPEIVERGLVSNMLGHCTPRESDMVRGTQNEDGLHHPVVFIKMDRSVEALV